MAPVGDASPKGATPTPGAVQSGETYCYENVNRDEIEAYLKVAVADGRVEGRFSGHHEDIGVFEIPFFGSLEAGRAEVTMVSSEVEEDEEIPGYVWTLDDQGLRVLAGDLGRVGPFEYRALSCAALEARLAEPPKP